ncbi:MAG: hypothetical protein ACT4OK_22830 [Gemmobacter sp.]
MTFFQPILRPADLPMSDEQATLLRLLCTEAGQPEAYDPALSAWTATGRINGLIDDLRGSILPPHTD